MSRKAAALCRASDRLFLGTLCGHSKTSIISSQGAQRREADREQERGDDFDVSQGQLQVRGGLGRPRIGGHARRIRCSHISS